MWNSTAFETKDPMCGSLSSRTISVSRFEAALSERAEGLYGLARKTDLLRDLPKEAIDGALEPS